MKYIPIIALCALFATGCASKKAPYINESFATDSPFKMKVDAKATTACESARRALLGQGYLIDAGGGDTVKGRKAYKTEDNRSTFIEMNVVCVADSSGSTIYSNGVHSTYDLKKSSSSASIGVKAVGSISLPFGQSADSMVKISEETIDDKKFYSGFFAAVDSILAEMEPGLVPAETFPAAPAPAPAPVAAQPIPVPSPLPALPQATVPDVPPPTAPAAATETSADAPAESASEKPAEASTETSSDSQTASPPSTNAPATEMYLLY